LRRRFPNSEVRFIDTVCQPTKQRQNAAIELAQHSDVVVVIGGAHSNNTHELVKTCSRYCERVYHVQTAEDLRAEWFENAEVVGVTAGTSTPDSSIREVENWLEELAGGKLQIPSSKLQRSADLQTPTDEAVPAVHRD
jgi:4-hydroxy-3-methylbut-2-en-1-yl diphosphate reductase